MNNLKKDKEIINKLKLAYLSRVICFTDKGMLTLQLRKGENAYNLILDSVPLDKETNKELMDLLFKAEIPQVNKEITTTPIDNTVTIKQKKAKK